MKLSTLAGRVLLTVWRAIFMATAIMSMIVFFAVLGEIDKGRGTNTQTTQVAQVEPGQEITWQLPTNPFSLLLDHKYLPITIAIISIVSIVIVWILDSPQKRI